ncbi:hypothetical protein DY000_02042961 [Brassica cretica]|uniref:Uncharacterized protein n=1 Tax=Brassica cretica TaxID=69181 RepID=A0ABQ7B8Q4_BRACR|nr:hypothetical protein DY000_02042961 [Brassica cretica]
MDVLFDSLMAVHEKDLALASVEGSPNENHLLKGDMVPTLDSEETRLLSRKEELKASEGDFDSILSQLQFECTLTPCSGETEGHGPVAEEGGDVASERGNDEAAEGGNGCEVEDEGLVKTYRLKRRDKFWDLISGCRYYAFEMSGSNKTGFRARPRFTFGLRLCDDNRFACLRFLSDSYRYKVREVLSAYITCLGMNRAISKGRLEGSFVVISNKEAMPFYRHFTVRADFGVLGEFWTAVLAVCLVVGLAIVASRFFPTGAATETVKKRRCTAGAEGEPSGPLSQHRAKAALKSTEAARAAELSQLEVRVSDLERDLGKSASALFKLKKEKKSKASEVRRLQREIQNREESTTGSLNEIHLLKGDMVPTLDSEETRLLSRKEELTASDGDFDSILSQLQFGCTLTPCSGETEGHGPVAEEGGDVASGRGNDEAAEGGNCCEVEDEGLAVGGFESLPLLGLFVQCLAQSIKPFRLIINRENSGFFEVRGRRSELTSRSLPPDDHRSSKTGFRARPRFTFGLRLCDDKSAFVLPVCDFYLIHTDIKSAKCYRLI